MKKRLNGEGSIYYEKSRKKWCATITIDGKKIIIRSATSEEAPDNLQKLRKKYGLIKYSGDMILSDWIDEWLFTVKSGSVSTKTLQSYQGLMKNHVKPHQLSSMKLSEITKMDVVKLFNQLLQAGASKQIIGKVKTRLYSCFSDASDMIERNPVEGVKIPAKAKDAARVKAVKAFTKAEQATLVIDLLQPKEKFVWDVMDFLILFALGTGMRLGELLALHYDRDFEDEYAAVHVDYNLQKMPVYTDTEVKAYKLEELPPKSKAGIRIIEIPESLRPKIKQHVLEIKKLSLKDPYFENHGLFFPDELGGYIERKRPQYHLKAAEKRLGLSSVNVHGLRHSYATRLLELGESIQVISTLLGHSTVEVTQEVYLHVLKDLKLETAKKVDQILGI